MRYLSTLISPIRKSFFFSADYQTTCLSSQNGSGILSFTQKRIAAADALRAQFIGVTGIFCFHYPSIPCKASVLIIQLNPYSLLGLQILRKFQSF